MIEKCFEGEGQEEEKRLFLRFTVNIYLQKLINLGQEDLILKHSFDFMNIAASENTYSFATLPL